MTIIQLSNNEILGGYTPLPWDTFSQGKIYEDSFLFNRDKKFKKAGKGQSIWCEGNYGWWSYHFGFQSSMSKLIKIGSISTYEDTQNLIKNEYNVKEVEVFKIFI